MNFTITKTLKLENTAKGANLIHLGQALLFAGMALAGYAGWHDKFSAATLPFAGEFICALILMMNAGLTGFFAWIVAQHQMFVRLNGISPTWTGPATVLFWVAMHMYIAVTAKGDLSWEVVLLTLLLVITGGALVGATRAYEQYKLSLGFCLWPVH